MRTVAITAILLLSIAALPAPDHTVMLDMSTVPKEITEETNKLIVSQMQVLEEAQEDLQKLRERYIRSLERDLRNYERRDDDKAVAAVKALIAAQEAAPSLITIGRELVEAGLPIDPSQPQDIFDTRTIEERKADLAAQREWDSISIRSENLCFQIVNNDRNRKLIIDDEFKKVSIDGDRISCHIDVNNLKSNGPILNVERLFMTIAPKTYENGIRPFRLYFKFIKFNGVDLGTINEITKKIESIGDAFRSRDGDINLMSYYIK